MVRLSYMISYKWWWWVEKHCIRNHWIYACITFWLTFIMHHLLPFHSYASASVEIQTV